MLIQSLRLGVEGLRVEGSGFKGFRGLGFRVESLGVRVFGFGV